MYCGKPPHRGAVGPGLSLDASMPGVIRPAVARSARYPRAPMRPERFLRTVIDPGAASIKRGANRKAPSHRHSWLGVSRPRRPALVV